MLSQTISTKIHAMRFASFRYVFLWAMTDIRRSPTLLRDSTNSTKERSFRKGDPANSHAARKYQASVV
jgi:hypothetical protein